MAKLEKHMIRLRPDQWEDLNHIFPGGTKLSVAAGLRLVIDAYLKRVKQATENKELPNLAEDIDL